MPDRPPKRPRDPAQLAKLMIDIASGEVEEGQPTAKQARARKAGTKGGPARSKALSPEQRSEIQRQGLGGHLLMDVFAKAAAISEYAGFYALTLTSMNADSTAFYESLNFRIYSENTKLPKMLYLLEDILTLVSAN
jgi:hypothetical protein